MSHQLHRDGARDWRPSDLPPLKGPADQSGFPASAEGRELLISCMCGLATVHGFRGGGGGAILVCEEGVR